MILSQKVLRTTSVCVIHLYMMLLIILTYFHLTEVDRFFIKKTMNYISDILYLDLCGQAQWWEEYEERLEEL